MPVTADDPYSHNLDGKNMHFGVAGKLVCPFHMLNAAGLITPQGVVATVGSERDWRPEISFGVSVSLCFCDPTTRRQYDVLGRNRT
jgi:hypothetical protein